MECRFICTPRSSNTAAVPSTVAFACQERPAKGEWDLKLSPGGMVDIEFIVQYVVLAHAHAHPQLTRNAGNIASSALSRVTQPRATAIGQQAKATLDTTAKVLTGSLRMRYTNNSPDTLRYVWFQVEQVRHQRDDEGLRNRLPVPDRRRPIRKHRVLRPGREKPIDDFQ